VGVRQQSTGSASIVSDLAISFALNIGSVSNRLVTVTVAGFDFDLTVPALDYIRCGGVDMLLKSDFSVGAGHRNLIYYLQPTSGLTGVQTVECWWTDIYTFSIIGVAFDGVDDVNPFGTVETANGSSTAPAVAALSPVSKQDAVIDSLSVVSGVGVTITAGVTGTTSTINKLMAVDPANNFNGVGSRCFQVPGGSCTRSYTLSASRAWRMQAVAIKEKQFGASITGRP
jgi:hypothetical protein